MRQLVIATHNPDKLREIEAILGKLQLELMSLADFENISAVEEDLPTIEGNAAKKALEIARATGMLCVADDTGLFISALDGAPGVFSARWAGEACSYRDNRLKALRLMKDITDRRASFRTVVALAAPDGIIGLGKGNVEGEITHQEEGENGFGYDSIFRENSSGQTYAQMSDELKNSLSHRALAFADILPLIRQVFAFNTE